MANLMNPSLMNKVLNQITDRIERLTVVDPLADRLKTLVAPLFDRPAVVELASGAPLGHPLHPLLVTMPIGSWSAALLFDSLKDPDAADIMVGLGVLTAVPAAFTGLSDWRYTGGAERRVGLVHAVSNTASIGLFLASLVARRSGHRPLGYALSIAGTGCMSLGGWLGGHLVYALGVGVDTTVFQGAAHDWTTVASESDLNSSSLTLGHLGSVPLVLTRTDGGRVVAYADRCTYRGSPLHRGELVDGCIGCPEHGCRFSVEDGSIVRGPASRPQPAYDVRVVDGRVEVRSTDEVRALRRMGAND